MNIRNDSERVVVPLEVVRFTTSGVNAETAKSASSITVTPTRFQNAEGGVSDYDDVHELQASAAEEGAAMYAQIRKR